MLKHHWVINNTLCKYIFGMSQRASTFLIKAVLASGRVNLGIDTW